MGEDIIRWLKKWDGCSKMHDNALHCWSKKGNA